MFSFFSSPFSVCSSCLISLQSVSGTDTGIGMETGRETLKMNELQGGKAIEEKRKQKLGSMDGDKEYVVEERQNTIESMDTRRIYSGSGNVEQQKGSEEKIRTLEAKLKLLNDQYLGMYPYNSFIKSKTSQ